MLLSQIMNGICSVKTDIEISEIVSHSKKITKGCVFVCIKGATLDGHDFALKAIEQGASAVVVERDMGISATQQLIVDNGRKALSLMAANLYGNPAKKLKLIGVTGTNGKTTISYVIKHIIEHCGCKSGLIGTIVYDTGAQEIHAVNTTPEPLELQSLFAQMVENGCEYCVMEASSQALDQQRLAGLHFEGAIFSNLSQDHLDWHGSMENYFLAKRMLLENSNIALVNADDEHGKRLLENPPCECYGYSSEGESDYFAANIKGTASGVTYWLCSKNEQKSYPITFAMPGLFSVGNSLCAAALCVKLGFAVEKVLEGINSSRGVPGRCEVLETGTDFTVILDFAHTPDALEKILTTIKPYVKGRLICLYGAAGKRDRTKRPQMGEITARLADYLVLTSDNPRDENEQCIINMMLVGVREHNTPYVALTDRRAAIYHAVKEAKAGDVLLLAGKGHEDYQALPEGDIHFVERDIVMEAVKEIYGKK